LMLRLSSGGYYVYFLCRRRQENECDLPYLSAVQMEDTIERVYANLTLPLDFAQQIEGRIAEPIADEQRATCQLRANIKAERNGSAAPRSGSSTWQPKGRRQPPRSAADDQVAEGSGAVPRPAGGCQRGHR
jgi:hypothetical protein